MICIMFPYDMVYAVCVISCNGIRSFIINPYDDIIF